MERKFCARTVVQDFYELETASYYKLEKQQYDTFLNLKKYKRSLRTFQEKLRSVLVVGILE
jgi:hypothetical protein